MLEIWRGRFPVVVATALMLVIAPATIAVDGDQGRAGAQGLVDAVRASGHQGPGEQVAAALSQIAEAEGVPVPALGPCPTLAEALAVHADRLGIPAPTPATQLPARADRALGCLLDAVHRANLAMEATFADVPTERLLPYVTGHKLTPPVELLEGRDHSEVLRASIQAAERTSTAIDLLDQVKAHHDELPPIDLEPILRFAPTGDTVHDDNYAVLVDLEGEDLYDNHAGGLFAAAGNGIYEVEEGSPWYETTVAGRPVSVGGNTQDATAVITSSLLLDMAGDDTYGVKKAPMMDDAEHGCVGEEVVPYVGTIGAGIVGMGQLYDLEGNNTYTGRTQTSGAGHILGVGVVYTGAGEDSFEAVRSAQGQGLLGGIGVLIDDGGDSTYRLNTPEQGVFNADLRFCDPGERYAQGSAFDRRNGPLLPSVGLLVDRGGDDVYRAGTLAQGFGQSPGAGVLVDEGGDDDYAALEKSQAFAQGRSEEFNQEAPWSSGQAILHDEAGQDRYVIQGPGQGYSIGNTTEDPPPVDTNEILRWSTDRNEAVAVFADRGGLDTYTGPLDRSNGELSVERTVGLFWDRDTTEGRR